MRRSSPGIPSRYVSLALRKKPQLISFPETRRIRPAYTADIARYIGGIVKLPPSGDGDIPIAAIERDWNV